MAQTATALTDLPVELLTYLVYDVIADDATLRAISKTCRLLRILALRRLSSETATLALTLAGSRSNIAAEFLKGQNRRSIGLTKKLVINVNSVESQCLERAEEYQDFLSDATTFVARCQNVERATLREASWLNDSSRCEIIDWTKRVLVLPKLTELFIDPCGRHLFRSAPDDEHLADIEGSDAAAPSSTPTGLTCLSVQAVSNGIYHYDYSQFSQLIQSTLTVNVRSLNRLWFNGPELAGALLGLPDGCLLEMRLRSLSVRILGAHDDFVRVFGLQLRSDADGAGALAPEDAVSQLQHLYLSDGRHEAGAELQLLRYLRTPELKSLQLGAQMLQSSTDDRRLPDVLSAFLCSFASLERFGVGRVKDASDPHYRSLVERVTAHHPGLKALAVWYSWTAGVQIARAGLPGLDRPLESLEMLCESTSGNQGLFATLSLVFRGENSPASLFIGHKVFEQAYWAGKDICVIVSTILYIHQKRENPYRILEYSTDENQTSPLVETPARLALFNGIKSTNKFRLSNLWKRTPQKAVANEYLTALSASLGGQSCQWLAKIPSWDKASKGDREAVALGLYNAIARRLPKGFRKLEVALKKDTQRIPREPFDRNFVWEQRDFGWELVRS
ncbi:hypothetical protein DRE_01580 [Drechslerella stenobrocha 248]|uniref:Uncharacterized protein n=1 Tax=Drechslerella stenobrocha 248 TaxID=1043628 RepID=W7HV17_9PEZI|nr:hypothetical protein DRE_01580 [Drechslerella stenobrocha 248]